MMQKETFIGFSSHSRLHFQQQNPITGRLLSLHSFLQNDDTVVHSSQIARKISWSKFVVRKL